jgi:glutathione synthase
MDPLETVVMQKDTSFALMLGARRRGHKVCYLPHDGITLKDGRFAFDVIAVAPQETGHEPFLDLRPERVTEDDIDVVFIRSDPPFDEEYLMHTWLLERLPGHIPVINAPNGIRTVNEKIWATQFRSIVPRTLITRKKNDLRSFLKEEKTMILKPFDSYGGASVFLVDHTDKNANVTMETLTNHWKRDVIAQQYIPEAEHGDKRILLLNGEPLGAVLRVHSEEDHRNNFFTGGKPVPAEIDQRDREIIDIIKPELQRLGLYFTGIDIIGGYLIEINVTSPTGLQEINRFAKKNLEDQVIAFVEDLCPN